MRVESKVLCVRSNTCSGKEMLHRVFQLLLIACLITGTLWAANDPFVGKWKVNPGKSKLTDEMKVEAAGANRYAMTLAPGAPVETIVADGSDQAGMSGTTLSVTVKGPNNWTVVRKKDGRTLLTADWTLSADGKTLTDEFTGYQTDGSKLTVHYVYRRTAGSSGFPGTWDSESEQIDSVIKLQIQPYEGDGLSISNSEVQMTQSLKLDGNDYPDVGPDAPPGLTSSGRRVNERSLEITHKFKGKIIHTQQIELSTDLKTLTLSIILAGENKPRNILVFDRE
jgi:hypothetical protein